MVPPSAVIRYSVDPAEWHLRHPHALLAFGGWVDAATAATGALRYLVNSLGGRKLADIDPEEFYSFTDTRPGTSVVGAGERAVHWPRGEFYAVKVPESTQGDLLVFVAPEPNLRWRTYAAAVVGVAQQAGARSLLALGSIYGAVHHRARVPLTGWATEPGLREALVRQQIEFPSYEGPTGFATVLVAEGAARGLASAGIFAFAPSYVQGVPNPRTSHGLLRAVAAVTGVPLRLDELDRAGRALARQVDRLLAQQPELREQVDRLLGQPVVLEPEGAGGEEESEKGGAANAGGQASIEFPSPEALVRDLEEYLRQLREKDRHPPDPSAG